MIIDAHVHLLKEKMWPKTFLKNIYAHKKKIMSPEEYQNYKPEGTYENLIREMDEAGVDVSVCLPIDNAFMCHEEPEIPIWQANEYIAEAQAKYPKRIVGFFSCDPMRPDAVDLLERGIKDLGLKGVKLFPGWFYPTDENVAPFMKKIEELGVPVLYHSGADQHPVLVKYCDPRYLDDILLKYPKLKMIAAHVSRGWEQLLTQMIVLRPDRIWTDLAGWQYEYISSRWYTLTQLRYFIDHFPDAIMLGSDWPFIKFKPLPSEKEWVDFFKTMELPQTCLDMGMRQFSKEEKAKLLGGNAQKLLNL